MRAYVYVKEGQAILHTPTGGNLVGFTYRVPIPTTPDGWYRCTATCDGRWDVEIGKRIDPAEESRRLARLANGHTRARTDKPGIKGYYQAECAATESLRALRARQTYLAKLLADATSEQWVPETPSNAWEYPA